MSEKLSINKDVDIADKKAHNRKKSFSERVINYLDSRKVGDFRFLCPEGHVLQLMSPEDAKSAVESGVFQYLKLDKDKHNLPNVKIEENGIAHFTYKCLRKTKENGALDTEEYIFLQIPEQDWKEYNDIVAKTRSEQKALSVKQENNLTKGRELQIDDEA